MTLAIRRGQQTSMRAGVLRPVFALLLLAGLLPGVACGTFPLSLYVDDDVLEELADSRFRDEVDEGEIAAALHRRLGGNIERVPLRGRGFYRADLAPGASFPVAAVDDLHGPEMTGLASGDILLAKNQKAQSLATTLAFEEFTFFNHLGLLAFEDDRAWVYESWPKLHLIGTSPDFVSRFRGHVKRIPLHDFLKRYEPVEVVRLPDAERNARAAMAARQSIERDIPYDPHHDPNNPGLSCSEYIEMLFFEEAGYPFTIAPCAFGRSASFARLSHSLGFRTSAYVVPDAFADLAGARVVGVLSRHRSLGEVQALRTAFAVLHARDDADNAPTGNYLAAHPWRFLVYRAPTLAFLEWAKGIARACPSLTADEQRAAIEELYDLCFRPRGS